MINSNANMIQSPDLTDYMYNETYMYRYDRQFKPIPNIDSCPGIYQGLNRARQNVYL